MIDIHTLKDFADLRDSNIHNFLCEQLDNLSRSLITVKDEITIRQVQGKSQMILEIIELIENASDLIEQRKKAGKDNSKMF